MKILLISILLTLNAFASGEHLGGAMGGGERKEVKAIKEKVLTDKKTNKTHNCKELDSNKDFVIFQCTK